MTSAATIPETPETLEGGIPTFGLNHISHEGDLITLVCKNGEEMDLPVQEIRRFGLGEEGVLLVLHRQEFDHLYDVPNVILLVDALGIHPPSRLHEQLRQAYKAAKSAYS